MLSANEIVEFVSQPYIKKLINQLDFLHDYIELRNVKDALWIFSWAFLDRLKEDKR